MAVSEPNQMTHLSWYNTLLLQAHKQRQDACCAACVAPGWQRPLLRPAAPTGVAGGPQRGPACSAACLPRHASLPGSAGHARCSTPPPPPPPPTMPFRACPAGTCAGARPAEQQRAALQPGHGAGAAGGGGAPHRLYHRNGQHAAGGGRGREWAGHRGGGGCQET